VSFNEDIQEKLNPFWITQFDFCLVKQKAGAFNLEEGD